MVFHICHYCKQRIRGEVKVVRSPVHTNYYHPECKTMHDKEVQWSLKVALLNRKEQ